ELAAQEEDAARAVSIAEHARQTLETTQQAERDAESVRGGAPSQDLISAQLSDIAAAEKALEGMPAREKLESVLAEAESAYDHLRTMHAATDIRRHLKAGDA